MYKEGVLKHFGILMWSDYFDSPRSLRNVHAWCEISVRILLHIGRNPGKKKIMMTPYSTYIHYIKKVYWYCPCKVFVFLFLSFIRTRLCYMCRILISFNCSDKRTSFCTCIFFTSLSNHVLMMVSWWGENAPLDIATVHVLCQMNIHHPPWVVIYNQRQAKIALMSLNVEQINHF